MRVTFLTHYPELYGANRSLLDLIEGLRAYGVHPSVLISGNGAMAEELKIRNVPFRVLQLGRWASRLPESYHRMSPAGRGLNRCRKIFGQAKVNARALPPVLAQLRAWNTEVVYSNSSLLMTGAVAAGIHGIPHIWHLREFGELDYGFVPDLGRTAQNWLINRADGVIAVSEAIRNHYLLKSSPRMKVIYSGIGFESDFIRLRDSSARAETNTPYTFALIGVLHPAKGQETAIYALHQLAKQGRDVRLILAGAGQLEYRQTLEATVDRLHLKQRVDFRGYTADVFECYRTADAVLMCSKNEGMGRVTAEAMAACRPVIGLRNAGTAEIVQDGVTGLLFEGGSRSLAAAMEQFVDRPDWARTLGMNGWHRARELFTVERYAAGVFDVLQQSLGARTRRLQALQPSERRSHIVFD